MKTNTFPFSKTFSLQGFFKKSHPIQRSKIPGAQKHIKKLLKTILFATTGMSDVQTRRTIREILLWSFADVMEKGELKSFISGDNLITLKCLEDGLFQVTYEPKHKISNAVIGNFLWNTRENKWKKV